MKKITFLIFLTIFSLTIFAQNTTTKTTKPTTTKSTIVKSTTTKSTKPSTTKTSTTKSTTTKPKSTITKMDTSTYVLITTNLGNIKIKLYDETPQHKSNFIKIIKEGVLDSTLFHRIIPEFMIQGGDPDSKNAQPGQPLGMGSLGYRVPAEFNKNLIHKKGALAAARDNNPAKASSASQFYIVQGKKYTDAELTNMAMQTGNNYTDAQKEIYKTIGGVPFLDMNYTVFGEVVDGLEVIDKIVAAQRDTRDRPLSDIRMKVEIVK